MSHRIRKYKNWAYLNTMWRHCTWKSRNLCKTGGNYSVSLKYKMLWYKNILKILMLQNTKEKTQKIHSNRTIKNWHWHCHISNQKLLLTTNFFFPSFFVPYILFFRDIWFSSLFCIQTRTQKIMLLAITILEKRPILYIKKKLNKNLINWPPAPINTKLICFFFR